MQQAAQALKDSLWGNLNNACGSYFQGNDELKIQTVEQIVVDVLKEQSQNQIDYVMKNIFRLDVDGSGTVSFIQLGNFLFKRHCGQMSLQRDHKAGKMSKGAQRIMTLDQFGRLLNSAYKFLGIACPPDVAQYIFKSVDADNDNHISYVEYFKVIELYACKGNKPAAQPKPEPQGKERFSKLRIHIWNALRRLYDAYVQGRNLQVNDAELRGLVFAIVGELSQSEITFLAAGLLQLNYQVISFQPFAIHFLVLIAELGLSRYSRNNAVSKKTLNRDQFIIVLKNSFNFAKLDKFKKNILYKIFAKIDKNNDGLITFDEYLDWVKRFVAVLKYFGDQFYVPEDDDELDHSDPFEVDAPPPNVDKNKVQFVFSDYTFARQVRARVYQLLIPYDADKNQQFNQAQINAALTGLLKEDQYELKYVTKNVFRYDRDNNNQVTYDELTNFCVEQHFGQMAIQRLHKKKFYSKGAERIMNKQEFGKTLNHALAYINLQASPAIIDLLFSEIDLDKDGWITYVFYFTFLKYYFGSASLAASGEKKVKGPSEYEKFLAQYDGLSPWDRFVRVIVDQLRILFFRYDYNKNQVFEFDQVSDILLQVFKFNEQQLEYILITYFNFLKNRNDNVSFQQLISIILTIYFIEIVFHRRYNSKDNEIWKSKKISLDQFISLINDACYFITYKPFRDDLIFIFNQLDTDKDGFITFQQYADFIRKYLGNGIDPFAKPPPVEAPTGISQEEYAFVYAIWDQLKVYFDKYDGGKKGFLNDVELKRFVVEVLNETTEKELNYVFWNLFRVDSNLNKEVDFSQFAPFILNHAGEISLQRFHKEQTKGKNSLSDQELYVVLTNAYRFLPSIPKQRPAISKIYARISSKNTVSYSGFLNWVHHALAAKYNKK